MHRIVSGRSKQTDSGRQSSKARTPELMNGLACSTKRRDSVADEVQRSAAAGALNDDQNPTIATRPASDERQEREALSVWEDEGGSTEAPPRCV